MYIAQSKLLDDDLITRIFTKEEDAREYAHVIKSFCNISPKVIKVSTPK